MDRSGGPATGAAALAAAVEGWTPSDDPAELAALWASIDRLTAKAHRAIGLVATSATWELEGATSLVAWLGDELGMAPGRAKRAATTARRLSGWPATAQAWEAGSLSGGQVEAIVANVDADAVGLFAEHEAGLVPRLAHLDVADTTTTMRAWGAYADDLIDKGDGPLPRRSRLCHSRTLDGRHRLDGDFDAEAGAVVALALGAAATPDVGGEPGRGHAERMADALTDICRSFLDQAAPAPPAGAPHTPAPGPARSGTGRGLSRRRPHLHLLCDISTAQPWLRDPAAHPWDQDRIADPDQLPTARRLVDRLYAVAGRARLIDGTPLDATTTRRLLCDADVHRVVTDAPVSVLDHGRATRTISPALYRALVVRDRGCRWPGCHRPPQWTEGHHIRSWLEGGPTCLDNLVLLCTRHHHLAHGQAGHPSGWTTRMGPDGAFETTSPTGQVRRSHPPP